MGVERLDVAGAGNCTHRNQTPNTMGQGEGVSLREITCVDKRETTLTVG